MQSIWASIALNLKITATGIVVGLTLYILGWIPVIGLIFSAISAFVWTPLVMSLNVFENTLTRRGLSFGEMCRFIRNHPIESLAVGAQTMILVAVPVLNYWTPDCGDLGRHRSSDTGGKWGDYSPQSQGASTK